MPFNQRVVKIIGVAVAAVVIVLLVLPLLINVNSFRPKIESELANAMGRQVTLGDLSLSLLRARSALIM